MNLPSLSIQTKVNLALISVFVLVLAASMAAVQRSETTLAHHVAQKTTLQTASSYFDSINMLMLSGAMANRSALQEKILTNEDLVEARILRADAVSKMYGEGTPDSKAVDQLDQRAMQGEHIMEETNDSRGHLLTVITPMRALPNYKGTNCLACHPVEEGTVLGAVRVTYDFASLDQSIWSNLLNVALIELGLFVLGVAVVSFLLRQLVIVRINEVQETIEYISENTDLRTRLPTQGKDEIGQMALAFNTMLDHFQDGLSQVGQTVYRLGRSSQHIHSVAEENQTAFKSQKQATMSVADAMVNMDESTSAVAHSANQTVEASDIALSESQDGVKITDAAIAAIAQMRADINGATEVIQQLDNDSQNVSSVLEVIQNIAEQTNLLALNAAIEAARAGEKGKGFAVVSDEVRSLAIRTHESTSQVTEIIHKLQDQAKHATQVMQQAHNSAEGCVGQIQESAQSLNKIASQMHQINTLNHTVANAVQSQATMTKGVEESVYTIADKAETASLQSSRLGQVSNELGSLANELDLLVKRFKV
ncbi:MAG: methyl-accepting chemotaxis protein [Pontibacterium sp.]